MYKSSNTCNIEISVCKNFVFNFCVKKFPWLRSCSLSTITVGQNFVFDKNFLKTKFTTFCNKIGTINKYL